MNRRTFLSATIAPVAFGNLASTRTRRGTNQRSERLLLRSGWIIDGSGKPGFSGDILLNGGRIDAVERRIDLNDTTILDCTGMVVAPGFIDIHGHSDVNLLINPRAESKIRQGVTTDVAGQDGDSIGPLTPQAAQTFSSRLHERHGLDLEFDDLEGYLQHLDRNPGSINLASMVGTGTVRDFVIGNEDRSANANEMTAMVRLVEQAISQGACGLSSGLEYVPGAFADAEELMALCRPLKAAGLPYASHMRNEDDRLFAAIEEALLIGRETGIAVQISHLKAQGRRNWWKGSAVLRMLETARGDGIDVMFDRYPYTAYSTGLSNLFPIWTRDGGTGAFLDRLADPKFASRIEAAVKEKVQQLGSWDSIQITSTANNVLSWAMGRRLGELAKERNSDPYELLLKLMREDKANTSMVGFGMSEDNTKAFLAHPLGMICSDGGALAPYGPLSEGTPHPRSYGSFPRVLGHYTRDERIMSLETAIRKMTSLPATRLHLERRGLLASGYHADVVVFNANDIADTATFADPHQYPSGIRDVFVNGEQVIRDGIHTGATPGRALRPTI